MFANIYPVDRDNFILPLQADSDKTILQKPLI